MLNGYAALKVGSPLVNYQWDPGQLGAWEVEVKVTHCGVCHSDVHLVDNDWHSSTYPLVPGHEIVGTVSVKGRSVNVLKRGDRVGIGWQSGACLVCEDCISGRDNLCAKKKATCSGGNFGGFADSVRVDSRFAFKIPDGLESEAAAPLMCGGITVYTPLRMYGIIPPMKVGVIGIGGLGHMALQFANAYGCEVTAFSSSPEKEKEARKFGAHHFVSSADKKALNKKSKSLDFIISTVYSDLDWEKYLHILKPTGKLCFVGKPEENVSVPVGNLIIYRQSVCGSNIGSRYMIQEMLEFAARHNITPKTESMPMEKAESAIVKVRNNKARYRVVLKN